MKTNLFNRKEQKNRIAGIPHSALRIPPWLLLFVLSALFAVQSVPAQTNNLRPAASAVMVNTNGVIVSPTNFFTTNTALLNAAVANPNATNLTGVVAPPHGGLGYANTNAIPVGATYDDGVAYGFSAYVVNVISNQTYFVLYPPGNSSGEVLYYGVGWESFGGPSQAVSGFFVAGTNHIVLYENLTGGLVGTQIWPVTRGVYGQLGGNFAGTISADATVPDSALSGNVQLLAIPLNETASGGTEHKLWSTNTSNGSTLSLIHYGTNGYADINLFTAPNLTLAQGSPTLHGAIGAGFGVGVGVSQFPYDQLYFESYLGVDDWYWVGANAIYGGLLQAKLSRGNFVWYQDGTTNTPMFEIDRTSKTITNYYPVVCVSNLTFSAANKGITAPLYTPTSSTETNFVGAIRWDANYLYLWTATNLNKRVALTTW